MADVTVAPRIRCDNCGTIEDKVVRTSGEGMGYARPKDWGTMQAIAGSHQGAYGGNARLDFHDLCCLCADAAYRSAAAALERRRSEGFDGPTGAE